MWQLPGIAAAFIATVKLCYSGRSRIHHRKTVSLSGLEVTPAGHHSVMIW
ncbi:hypothetical protein IC615_01545 [Serratia ureilytica]